jgi:hypothetical protein
MGLKGLAQAANFPEDRVTLGVKWWYTWGVDKAKLIDPTYIPMLRTGLEKDLPQDYDGFCLLFNEPENKEPNGIGISVTTMVSRYETAIIQHPKTKFVVGGVGWNQYAYMSKFRSILIKENVSAPDYWHVHAYVYRSVGWTTSKIKTGLKKFKTLGGLVWITEYAVPTKNVFTSVDFKSLTSWINSQDWIERYAAFTNRQQGKYPWELGHGCDLLTWPGELTSIGKYYSTVS